MYKGPWQENKLARILKLKDQVEREEREGNKLEGNSAASLSNKGTFNMQNNNQHANSEGFKHNYNNKIYESSEGFKQTGMSEQNFPSRSRKPEKHLPKRANRNRSHNLPKPKNMKYQYPAHLNNNRNVPDGRNNFKHTKASKATSGSPTSNNTNYSSQVMKSTVHSAKYAESESNKSEAGMPSNRTLRAGSYDKFSNVDSNSDAQTYGNQVLYEMRKNNFFKNLGKNNANRVLEVTYDKWNRFENFVKFATTKQIKDRLKEVDPPAVEHYVDGDVVYKIKEMGQGRPPRIIKKPLVTKNDVKKQHRERVNKMREVYGLKHHQPQQPIKQDNQDSSINRIHQTNQVFEYKEQSESQSNESKDRIINNQKPSNQIVDPKVTIENKKTANNSASLYSFYQNIIDKNNVDISTQTIKDKLSHPKYQIHSTKQQKVSVAMMQMNNESKSNEGVAAKESPSLENKASKFKNAGREIIHSSPHHDLGKAQGLSNSNKEESKLPEIIEEEHINEFESPNLKIKAKANAFDESDGDGLINWALNLPEELSGSHTSQFYKNKQC